MNAKSHNIQMLEAVASGFKGLLSDIVFVGGATTTLYLMGEKALSESSFRPTQDVDCVIEVTSRARYAKLEKQFRSLGFKNLVQQGAPLCRWIYCGITVDIMPTDEKILGFSNDWYGPGISAATTQKLPSGTEIRVFTVPFFLASKIEAFKKRGNNDFLGSRDFEDVISVIEGRKEIRKELNKSPVDVKKFLKNQFAQWSRREDFLQSILAHLPSGRRTTDHARRVLDIVKNI